MIFDLVLYALAIAAVLTFVAPSNAPQRPIHRTLETLHAIGEALPDEVFEPIPDVDVPDYDELFAQADEIGDRHSEVEQDDISDLLAVSAPRTVDTRWLSTMTTHGLRTLGSLLDLKGARRWTKDQAIAHLTSHYAMA